MEYTFDNVLFLDAITISYGYFISGMDFPFDVKAGAAVRKEQLEKWRQWLQASGGLETPPAPGGSETRAP